jgi:hypothetical protein
VNVTCELPVLDWPLEMPDRAEGEFADGAPEEMSASELVEFLQVLERKRARLDALRVRAMASLSRQRRDPQRGTDYASDEVAAALSWTPVAAARQVNTALAMVERLPRTVAALECGELDVVKAMAITEQTRLLTPVQATEIESRVLPFAIGRTVRRLRDKLAREILKIDPAGEQARRKAAAEEAFVRFRPCPDGMAELLVYDKAENLRPVHDLLTTAAHSAKAAGATSGLDQLRTTALRDLVLGANRERVVTEFRVTIPASALAGASMQPVEIHGYGPTTLDLIHELADENTFWRRIVTDPLTGSVLDVGRRRRHTTALGEHIRTRDKRCVFKGCARPAESCHLDHTHDHAHGGPTSAANLGALCPRHNQMKQQTTWRLSQPEPGHFVWTSPTGATYHVAPEPVVEPEESDHDPPPF